MRFPPAERRRRPLWNNNFSTRKTSNSNPHHSFSLRSDRRAACGVKAKRLYRSPCVVVCVVTVSSIPAFLFVVGRHSETLGWLYLLEMLGARTTR
jgi:hypothetical protein